MEHEAPINHILKARQRLTIDADCLNPRMIIHHIVGHLESINVRLIQYNSDDIDELEKEFNSHSLQLSELSKKFDILLNNFINKLSNCEKKIADLTEHNKSLSSRIFELETKLENNVFF